MAHVPHLFRPRPWTESELALDPSQIHHLRKVLRMGEGEPVSYTDGEGTVGLGTLGPGLVIRSDETRVPAPHSELTMAVAPPVAKDRARFLVEKLAELGVSNLLWLRTRLGRGKPPSPERSAAWAQAALEQSRGAWLMRIDPEPRDWEALPPPVVVADTVGGSSLPTGPVSVAVGPEGGWEPDEVPVRFSRISLGPRVLRVETAAVVAAARMLAVGD